MKLKKLLFSCGLLCTALTVLVMLAHLCAPPPLRFLEGKIFEQLLNLREVPEADEVVLVEVDRQTQDAFGGWPLPRTVVAEALASIEDAKARAIGLHVFYRRPEHNPALLEIRRLRQVLSTADDRPSREAKELVDRLDEACSRLDGDGALARTLHKSGRVVLPVKVAWGASAEGQNGEVARKPLPKKALLPLRTVAKYSPLGSLNDRIGAWQREPAEDWMVLLPAEGLTKEAAALGHVAPPEDVFDGARRFPLVITAGEDRVPAMALQLVTAFRGVSHQGWSFIDGRDGFTGLVNGDLKIPTDRHLRMLLDSRCGRMAKKLSMAKLLSGEVPPETLQGRIVLLGLGSQDELSESPAGASTGLMTETAGALTAILKGSHLVRPSWSLTVELAFLLYLGLFLSLVIPCVRFGVGLVILTLFLAAWWAAAVLLFVDRGVWLQTVSPALLVAAGLTLVALKRSVFSEERSREAVELHKMLGLSLQGQGLLDLAYEKFMKCPLEDPSVKDLLYNLGLDFERKRMSAKAVAVYQHLLKKGRFRDVKQRLARLQDLQGRDYLAGRASSGDGTVLLESAETKPTLGRYEILKELGQGAMGTVYLGRDPKINREVAIKTLRYQDVEPEQLEEVKKRFFREAEAAGQLMHPNIVTIYDVGEEQDLAYLAMELLRGSDLTSYCQPQTRLPTSRALQVALAVAEALDYAHSRGVVHRDIKPANIMLLEDGSVKVTDFGIARVVSTSATQTGMILGTPNYMSPEQFAGKSVDGRSDIFSLGAVLYELLVGAKAFTGEDLAALMYRVTRGKYVPLGECDLRLPACCAEVVDKMLSKPLTRRFRTAGEAARQLEACIEEVGR